jgi:uncharacterized membrane protein YedE/YeeE
MTETTATRSISTKPLRVAGVLFIVAGVASIAAFATTQYMGSIHQPAPDTFGPLILIIPILAAAGISAVALAAAYVALYVLRPRGVFHWIFLLAAFGHLVDAARNVIPAGGIFGIGIALVGALGAGIYVAAGRRFTPIPSMIFLATAIVGVVAVILPLVVPGDSLLLSTLLYVTYALYVVSGVGMIRGARTMSKATE